MLPGCDDDRRPQSSHPCDIKCIYNNIIGIRILLVSKRGRKKKKKLRRNIF